MTKIIHNFSHSSDTAAEHDLIKRAALENGAFDAVIAQHFSEGGAGAVDLADALVKVCSTTKTSKFHYLYDLNASIEDKILKISQEMYGAGGIELHQNVKEKIKLYYAQGFHKLPICMAKTSNSLTGDASIKGAPTGFTLVVNDIIISAGAGFIVPIIGDITKMPGLSTRPCFYDMDLDTETGQIEGLF